MLLFAPIISKTEEIVNESTNFIEIKLESHIFELIPTVQNQPYKYILERAEEIKQQKIKEKQMELEMLKLVEKTRQEIFRKEKSEAYHMDQSEIQPEQTDVSNLITFEATYYTPYCYGCSGVTFTGYDVRNTIYFEGMRIVASDNNILPLYSIIEIISSSETFTAIVLDRGSSIKNNKLDILVADVATAKKLGRHSIQVRVIRYGK